MNVAETSDYYGEDMSEDSLEAFIAKCVLPKHWDAATEQYGRKWFGYRFLSPGKCLHLFADRYRRAYAGAKGRGLGRGSLSRIFTNPNFIRMADERHISSLWHAMAHADDIGVPYDFYCTTVFEIADREGWDNVPMPNQIYHERMIWRVKQAWLERLQSGTLVRTSDPYYALANFHQHPWQIEYQDWLLNQALSRPNPKFALAKILFEEPQVLPSRAARTIGVERVVEAKRNATVQT